MKKLLKIFMVVFVVSLMLATFAACKVDCKGEHKYGEWHEATVTCTEGGTVGYYQCIVCAKYFDADGNELAADQLEVPALGHTFTDADWHAPVAGDCQHQGTVGYYHCDRCGKNFGEDKTTVLSSIDVTGTHVLGDWVAEVAATCTTEGALGHYECSVCHKYFDADKNEIESIVIPFAHVFGEWVNEVPATCTTSGTKGYKDCTLCHKHFDAEGNEIPDLTIAAGHTFGEWVNEVPATCTANGTKGYKDCSVCHKHFDAEGKELPDIVDPAKGHTWSTTEIIAGTVASCSAEGSLEHWHCTACNKDFAADKTTVLESVVVAKSAHTLVKMDAVAATCETAGNVEYWHCSACEANFSDDKGTTALESVVVAALGHDVEENVCQRDGCGKTFTAEEIVTALYALEQNASLPGTYKLTGVISEILYTWSKDYPSVTFNITVEGKTVQVYRYECEQEASKQFVVGLQVTVSGSLKHFYNSSKETSTYEFDKVDAITDIVAPNYKVTVESFENGTIEGLNENKEYANGATVTFKVNANEGFVVSSAMYNDELLVAAADGTYSFTISSDVTIKITIVAETVDLGQKVEYAVETIATEKKLTNAQKELTLVDDELFEIKANGGENTGKYYSKDNSWRIYSSESGKITITAKEGYKIISVSVEFSEGGFDKIKQSGGGCIVNGTSVVLTATKKTFVTSITVVYRSNCDHANAIEVKAVAATCEKAGNSEYWHCADCGKYFSDEACTTETTLEAVTVAAKGHKYVEQAAEEATCTEAGNQKYYTCENCSKIFDADKKEIESVPAIAAKGHTPQKVDAVASTCTTKGNVEHWTCTVCHANFSDEACKTPLESVEVALDGNAHNWGAWKADAIVEGKDPTHTRVCQHNSEHTETADCTFSQEWKSDVDNHWHECTVCGQVSGKAVHDFGESDLCECGLNHYSLTATIGEETQEFKTLVEAIAWATEKYNAETPVTIALKNSLVGSGVVMDNVNVIIDLGGYTYTVTAPTVGSPGTETNGFQLLKGSTVVFKNGKIDTNTEAAAKILIQNYSNLTFDGVTLDGTNLVGTYVSSNNFGTILFKGNSEIIAKETGIAFDVCHGWNSAYADGVSVTVEDGCKITGTIEYAIHATACAENWQDTVKLVLPQGTYTIVVVAKDGDVEGLTCATANITIGDKRLECAYGEWTTVTPATCKDEGSQERVCSVCGHKDTDKLPVDETAHSLQEVAAKDATCTEDGVVAHKHCALCEKDFNEAGEELTSVVVLANGHSLGDKVDAKDATCTEDGHEAYYECGTCGAKFSDAEGTQLITGDISIPASHTWDSETIHPATATCTEAGQKAHWYCSVCQKYFDEDQSTEISDLNQDALGHDIKENACQRVGCTHVMTQSQVIAALELLGKDEYLPGTYKLTGVIKSVNAYSTSYGNIDFVIDVDGTEIKVFRWVCTKEQSAELILGAQVTVVGELTNYYGNTLEFAKKNYAIEVRDITPIAYTISSSFVDGEATVSGLPASENCGETVEFTVKAAEGRKISSVTVNKVAVIGTANEDGSYSYSFVVTGNMSVEVSTAAEGEATIESIAKLTFPDDNSANNKNNGYSGTWYAKIGNRTWTIENFNNYNWNGWTYIKTGHKKNAIVGTISVGFAEKITSVKLTVDKVTSDAINSIKLYVYSDDECETQVGDAISVDVATGTLEFEIPETVQAENLYYKIAIDCAANSNGSIQISAVEYFGYAA